MKPVLTPWSGSGEQRRIVALLGSLCLFLSTIEYIIPRPLPFMRIGLANLPLLLALDILGPVGFFFLALLKVIGQGIIAGTLFSYVFLFSLAGTFASALLMYTLRSAAGPGRIGFGGIGCAGAMVSNVVQLLLARYFVFGSGLRFLVPPFLASGFITGLALGLFCEAFCRRSRWYAKHTGNETGQASPALPCGLIAPGIETIVHSGAARRQDREERRLRRGRKWASLFGSSELLFAGLLMLLLFLFNPSTLFRFSQFVFFCFIAWFSGKKNNPLVSALLMAGIVFFNLLAPYGKVLAEWGPLRVTQGSLLAGLQKAVTVEGLLMLSGACVKRDMRLPGKFGALAGESFRLLELLRERKGALRHGNIIAGIDWLLLELEHADTG
ncbi:MAG: Gx transporter family protein, partial [Treponema sp.]|nr:Gx transporter family protein [Treponema sp.]